MNHGEAGSNLTVKLSCAWQVSDGLQEHGTDGLVSSVRTTGPWTRPGGSQLHDPALYDWASHSH